METHVAIVPTPGMGHLIPLVQFAKKLLQRYNFSTTFIIPTDKPLPANQTNFLSTLPTAIDYILLPSVNLNDLPNETRIETYISLTISRSIPSISNAVKYSAKKFNAFIVDMFAAEALDVANEFNIPSYVLFPSPAMVLSLFLYLPELDKTVSCEYSDVAEKIRIPGCVPIHGKDLFDPVQDRKNDAYKWVLELGKKFKTAEGIMVNSFKELEPGAFEALQQKENGYPIIYPIGPLIQPGSSNKLDEPSSICIKWLNEQPSSSVLYISFGSGATLCHEQMIELALGLELSEQRFLFVTRCPSDKNIDCDDPLAYLPKGFLDRTKGRGLVVPNWAPQAQILAHESVYAFLTHCGWNSSLEGIVNGLPLIAWPICAEQKMNAVMLHEDVRVALRPKVGANGLVGMVEICNVVKGLMEGEEGKGVRRRVRELKDVAEKVMAENGSSMRLLDQLAAKWKRSNCN